MAKSKASPRGKRAVKRTAITPVKKPPRLDDVEMAERDGSKADFEAELKSLQLEMVRIQRAYHREKRRAAVVFEGWDAGGKGGSIRRLCEKLDPRGYRVHAIGAPTSEEQGKHYLWRFWQRLPAPGEIAVFDRSWYGRVLVERVEGFCAPDAWARAYDEINEMERLWADDGVAVVKVFLHITPEEQRRRFIQRLKNPYKRWKLTAEDLRNRERWDEYAQAIDEMLARTSTKFAPWTVVGGDHKWSARLSVVQHVIETLGDGVDTPLPELAPDLRRAAEKALDFKLDK